MIWSVTEVRKLYCVSIEVHSAFWTWIIRLCNLDWVHQSSVLTLTIYSSVICMCLGSVNNKRIVYANIFWIYYKPLEKLLWHGSADKYFELSKSYIKQWFFSIYTHLQCRVYLPCIFVESQPSQMFCYWFFITWSQILVFFQQQIMNLPNQIHNKREITSFGVCVTQGNKMKNEFRPRKWRVTTVKWIMKWSFFLLRWDLPFLQCSFHIFHKSLTLKIIARFFALRCSQHSKK